MKIEVKNYLENALENLKNFNLSNNAKDFISCRYTSNFNDSFNEYADSNVNVYYNHQRDFYYNNTSLCDETMREYGYYENDFISDFLKHHDLDDLICKAGAIGEYKKIYDDLVYYENEIKEYILLEYILNDDNKNNLSIEDIQIIIDDINCTIDDYDDLIDLYNNYLTSDEIDDLIDGYIKAVK